MHWTGTLCFCPGESENPVFVCFSLNGFSFVCVCVPFFHWLVQKFTDISRNRYIPDSEKHSIFQWSNASNEPAIWERAIHSGCIGCECICRANEAMKARMECDQCPAFMSQRKRSSTQTHTYTKQKLVQIV